jgi:preprotein translocase subunit SecF
MINFLKYRSFYFVFSFLVILVGWYFVLGRGFVYSIDFVGGGLIEFIGNRARVEQAETIISQKYPNLEFQKTSVGFIVRSANLNRLEGEKLRTKLSKQLKVKEARYEIVGPTISQGNIEKILMAAGIALLGILIYVAISFRDWRFGVAALAALLHDTLALIGVWAVLGYFWGVELDVLFVTAILTTMSFSVHDTIVIFDKIQEEERQGTYRALEDRINWSLNLTMMRSLNNSLTVLIMLSSLIILGGESTRWFAVSLLIGTLFGTYSSPFVATPLYYLLSKKNR